MTREERIRLESAIGMSIEEIEKKERIMSPALKRVIEEKAASS